MLTPYLSCLVVGGVFVGLKRGGVTRIRLKVGERERTMLAATLEPRELAAGARVLVLGIDARGRAEIEPEDFDHEED